MRHAYKAYNQTCTVIEDIDVEVEKLIVLA